MSLLLASYCTQAVDALFDIRRPLARSDHCKDIACRRAWLKPKNQRCSNFSKACRETVLVWVSVICEANVARELPFIIYRPI